MFEKYFELKQILYLNPQSGQVNEAKLHRCALDWSDKCAFCDLGYDELKSLDTNSEEYSQLLLDKINKSTSKLEDIELEFEEKLYNNLAYTRDLVEVRVDSLKEEVSFEPLKNIKDEISSKITNDISELKSNNFKNLEQLSIESIEKNIKEIQDYFDFNVQFSTTTHCNLHLGEIYVCMNKNLSSKWHYINKDFSYNIKRANFYDLGYLREAVSVGENRIAIPDYKSVKIWNFKIGSLIHELNFKATKLLNLYDENLLLIGERKIMVFNLKTFECNENEIESEHKLLAAIDGKTFVSFFDKKDSGFKWYLRIYELNGLKLILKHNREVNCYPRFLFKVSKNRLVGASSRGAYVWDLDGNFIEEIKDVDIRDDYLADVLCENILIGCGHHNGKFVRIWDFDSGECIKQFKKHVYGGKTAFGFLVSDEELGLGSDYAKAYRLDEDFTYLGMIFSGKPREYENLKHLVDNIYKSGSNFYEVDWKFKERKEGPCSLPTSNRCAHCEIGLKSSQLSKEEIEELLMKTNQLFEECEKIAFQKLDAEENRFIESFNKLIDKIASDSCDILENYIKNYLLKSIKATLPKNLNNLTKLELLLSNIQKYYGFNLKIIFDYDKFTLKEEKIIRFALEQRLCDLPEKYFDDSHYRELDLIKTNSSINDIKCFGKDSIIYTEKNKFVVLNLSDKTKKRLFDATYCKTYDVLSNRFLISCNFRNQAYEIVFWNFETSKSNKVAIDNVTSLLALKNGKLLIATFEENNVSIGIWSENDSGSVDEPLFKKTKEINDTHSKPVSFTIELPDNLIATASEEVICIWNCDMSDILYKLNGDIKELHYVLDNTLLICNDKEYFFWNYKNNFVLDHFQITVFFSDKDSPKFSFLTEDKRFLVILFKNYMKFFDTNGFYYYSNYPIIKVLKGCNWRDTTISNEVFFHKTSYKEIKIFDFKS